jgi:hypothetical protein
MSFRFFVYYCASCGGCMAYGGWVMGRLVPIEQYPVALAGLKGLFLGITVAFGLGVIDALCKLAPSQVLWIGLRAIVAAFAGALGGLFGGAIGQALYGRLLFAPILMLSWIMTGLLIGVGVGVFDLLARVIREEDAWGAARKLIHCVIGGTLGGFLGGVLYLMMLAVWHLVFHDQADTFWSPSAWGFVALGLCIGLLIGLAQIILKEAWIRVESGFRSGRELILSKGLVTIGRAESCDIGLFGDPGVEKLHARLIQRGSAYFIEDAGTPSGTFVNDQRINGAMPLRNGDTIRVGKCVLRFGERRKRAA